MMDAGMSVARLNFSHGDHSYHQKVIDNVRLAAEQCGKHIAILLDTKGPEIRSGKLRVGPDGKKLVYLKEGTPFTFVTDYTVVGDETKTATSYKKLPQTVKPGDHILVSDGLLSFTVQKCFEDRVECTVDNPGVLGETKGMNLPGVKVDLPGVTEKDKADIDFGVRNKIDMIAASFIRKPEDVMEIRALPGVTEQEIMIISKIESQEGLDNFDEVLKVSDGIMVARGDLGVEIPIQKVATAQKMMIHKCNMVGKPVITATQMLDSMIENPRPTRAEATDVANAVYDGTDCVMLSGETANGKYPIETIKVMGDICRHAEAGLNYRKLYKNIRYNVAPPISVPESIASSAVKSCWDLKLPLIIALTESGRTPRLISKYRPHSPTLCVTSSARVARQTLLSRGIYPCVVPSMKGTTGVIQKALEYSEQAGFVLPGDAVIVTSGFLEGISGSTNIMKVEIVPRLNNSGNASDATEKFRMRSSSTVFAKAETK
eukprot:TRINITY_DN2174_c0_g1_i1.p1 TRINITY_DN2174_c0_g1~~TRINITY_DN2174_c0_g1_i1.p1  ORF type:complete len:560 (-),score=146.13 TRINITY_DN2174_c0_g1_i1:23-1486(-)